MIVKQRVAAPRPAALLFVVACALAPAMARAQGATPDRVQELLAQVGAPADAAAAATAPPAAGARVIDLKLEEAVALRPRAQPRHRGRAAEPADLRPRHRRAARRLQAARSRRPSARTTSRSCRPTSWSAAPPCRTTRRRTTSAAARTCRGAAAASPSASTTGGRTRPATSTPSTRSTTRPSPRSSSQPLLRDFRTDATRTSCASRPSTATSPSSQLRSVVTNTLADVRNAYWDYVYTRGAVEGAAALARARAEAARRQPRPRRSRHAGAHRRRPGRGRGRQPAAGDRAGRSAVEDRGAGAQAPDRLRHRRSALARAPQSGRSAGPSSPGRSISKRRCARRSTSASTWRQGRQTLAGQRPQPASSSPTSACRPPT